MKRNSMKDVTDKVQFGLNDDECLPLEKCVCGELFDYWSEVIGIYKEYAWKCPKCGIELIFRPSIRVYSVNNN